MPSNESEFIKRIIKIEKWLRRLETLITRPTVSSSTGTTHDEVTVVDTATINLTLVGQQLQADAIGGGSAHVIKDEGGAGLTARANLNFAGAGVTATDNAGTSATDITIPGGDVATDTIWVAKGDLAVGTGVDTAAILTVGADGKYLKAASGEATGVMWDTPAGGAVDASVVTYTPTTAADWDSGADPGDADNAFDQLAERVKDLEGVSGGTDGWIANAGTWTPRSQAFTNDPAAGANIELEMVDTSGFDVGDVIKVTSGAGSENALITVVHANTHLTVAALYLNHDTTTPSVKFADTLYVERAYTNDPASGANIELAMTDTTGFSVGDLVEVSSSIGRENATITVVHANTHLTVNTLALDHTTTAPMVKQVVQNTFIVDTSSDYSGSIAVGQRIKFTDSTVKYFILVAISTTRLTLYGGTDYSVVSTAAVTSPYYSMMKAPNGFPLSKTKWMIKVTDSANRSQLVAGAATWYNLGSISISVPIGNWNLEYIALLRFEDNSTQCDVKSTLSTANNSQSDAEFTSTWNTLDGTILIVTARRGKTLDIAARTNYYLNALTSVANSIAINFRGDLGTTTIFSVCEYL